MWFFDLPCFLENHCWGFPGGPVSLQRVQVWSLVGGLRFHMCGQKKKLIKENHYLLSGFRASSRSNGKHGLSRLIQSPLKAYSVIPVTHLSCLPCTHWPNVPRIASSPEFYAHGTSQMLFVSEVTRNCDTQLLWAPLLMHWLHCRIRLHLQNSSSEVKLFRISRGNSKAWGPFECGALCDCTGHMPMKIALVAKQMPIIIYSTTAIMMCI